MSASTEFPTIAVIVPVYNVERYLAECLESVAQQDYAHWSATVVVDGSPDKSEEIARSFEARDPRFRVISVPNGGLGWARNVGFKHSTSDFVFWLDSDDILPPGTLSALAKAAARTGSDITAGYAEDFGTSEYPSRYWTQNTPLFAEESTFTARDQPRILDDHVVWNKLYRRSLLEANQLDFPIQVHCEDMVFSARAALAANSITVIPRLVYRHRRHDEAISASYTRTKTLVDWLGQSRLAIEVLASSGTQSCLDHYLVRFVTTQWWTRARGLHEIESDDLIQQLGDLSRLIADMLPASKRKWMGRLESAALDFFATDDPRVLLDTQDRSRATVLSHEFGRDVIEAVAVVALADELASGTPAARSLAEVLWVDRALQPAADGWYDVPIELAADFDRVASSYGRDEMDRRIRRNRRREVTPATFILEKGRPAASMTSVIRVATGVQLRGECKLTPGIQNARTATITFTASDDPRPPATPVTWIVNGDSVRWQAVIAYGDARRDTPLRPVLHFANEGLPRGSAQIVLNDSVPPEARGGAGTFVFSPSVLSFGSASRRVFTIPAWRDNPFVTMLQLATTSRGYVHERASKLDKITAELQDRGKHGLVHIHWPDSILEGATSEASAESRVDAFLGALRMAHSYGRPIVWTLHNALPHDHPYRNVALRLQQGIVAVADAVHLLNSHSLMASGEDSGVLPEKTVHIPHASYAGVYGAPMRREEARAAIGMSNDVTGVLHFGQIRPYKGVESLLDAMRIISSARPEMELMLAGKPTSGWTIDEQTELRGLRATTKLRRIEDHEIPEWFSAADVLVLPYRHILNSGTMHLAAPFGLPTILPNEPHVVAEFGDQAWLRFFDTEQPAESIAQLLDSDWYREDDARESAMRFSEATLPMSVARRFADLVDSLTSAR